MATGHTACFPPLGTPNSRDDRWVLIILATKVGPRSWSFPSFVSIYRSVFLVLSSSLSNLTFVVLSVFTNCWAVYSRSLVNKAPFVSTQGPGPLSILFTHPARQQIYSYRSRSIQTCLSDLLLSSLWRLASLALPTPKVVPVPPPATGVCQSLIRENMSIPILTPSRLLQAFLRLVGQGRCLFPRRSMRCQQQRPDHR